MNKEIDLKTKEELGKILEDMKQKRWINITDEEKVINATKYQKEFNDIISIVRNKLNELINNNNPESVMALKDCLMHLINKEKGVSHSLLEIAYRRSHNKY